MTIALHNTLTRKVEPLEPLNPSTATIYSCGPTVYDHAHIGNISAFITADVLRRTITGHGMQVKHVMNFTDVDDKTIQRSREAYPDMDPMAALNKLTQEYGELFLKDMHLVGNDISALTIIKATEQRSIEGMKSLISELYSKGYAYVADDGIYFSIEAYTKSGKTYGQLVELSEESTNSQRIQNDEYDKNDAHDFALWKTQKTGEPAWELKLDGHDIPGRPGWHIECSVMSRLELGQPFDIHTGGVDLMFPHHENEIAQSTAGEGNPVYATSFIHNEHILVDGKKMSKSAGNYYTLTDLINQGVEPLAFRLLVLQSHYRRQTNFSFENAAAASSRLQHWRAVAALRWQVSTEASPSLDEVFYEAKQDIISALADDINTPEAFRRIDVLFASIGDFSLKEIPKQSFFEVLETIDSLLGLQLIETTPDIDAESKALIAARQTAREAGDWTESDAIRDSLIARGIAINDTADGSIWSYTT